MRKSATRRIRAERPGWLARVRVCTAAGAIASSLAGCAGEIAGACNPTPPAGELGTICGFQNPEDVEVIASLGTLIVSEMSDSPDAPGFLSAVDLRVDPPVPKRLWPAEATDAGYFSDRPGWLDASCTTPPDGGHFSPHGIGAHDFGDGTALLAVVSHGPREAIEVFELHRQGGPVRARWLGCLRVPPRTIPNDVTISGQGSVSTTRHRPSQSNAAAIFYSIVAGLGGNTGEVLRKLPGQDWEAVANSRGAGPNGLVQSSNAVYFAQTGPGLISRVFADGTRRDVSIEGYPDNLSWSRAGTIYAVSHMQGLRMAACSAGWRPCRTAWSLFEIEPGSLQIRERLHHDGSVLGAAASVAYFKRRLFFGAVYGDRIGVLLESGDRAAGVLQTSGSNGSR